MKQMPSEIRIVLILVTLFFGGCAREDSLPTDSPIETPQSLPTATMQTVVSLTPTQEAETALRTEEQIEEEWAISEYSGSRSERDLRVAMASKGFAWLSGSPADNEKLSIGKNAQFFGFVALRYQSGRAANRGALGRAFFMLTDSDQQEFLQEAVLVEAEPLSSWWEERESLLTVLETHLYTNEPLDVKGALEIGARLSRLNATVALHEAQAFATLEDSLSDEQWATLWEWREDPELAYDFGRQNRMVVAGFERDQIKQLEDLYAKAFSWLTGTVADNEIIPLGQPAQFFGFVSIRHKSGQAASRGNISKSFLAILSAEQIAVIDEAVQEQMPIVAQFLAARYQFLEEMALLRTMPDVYDEARAMGLATRMGELEAEVALLEARAYRQIRVTMTDDQLEQMMALRGEYIVDEAQVEILSFEARGEQLAILCSGCHGDVGEHRPNMVGPTLDGIFNRPIASTDGYEYSDALQAISDDPWTAENLNQFLSSPQAFAPGTKMAFQGLLNEEDRSALINYLLQTR